MSSITFKPSADRVLVKPDPAEEKTASGLLIADTAKEKPQRGEVIAVGPGKTAENGTLVAPTIKVGDKILYGKYSGTELSIEGTDYLIMKESDVFGTL